MRRRPFLFHFATLFGLGTLEQKGVAQSTATEGPRFYPSVVPRTLIFPKDHGAHPLFRTEWWYLTAWLDRGPELAPMGFQFTFFRSRTRHSIENPSRFAPQQLLFAHLALAMPEQGRLAHADRAARAGPAGVHYSTETTDLALDDWIFRLTDEGYEGLAHTPSFSLRFLASTPSSSPLILRGRQGVSRKGPQAESASYYYSRTGLPIQLSLSRAARNRAALPWQGQAQGMAWLDHEWSSSLLPTGAVGWDWMGIHLNDGGSLMAFRIRDQEGKAIWQETDWRDAAGQPRKHANPDDALRLQPVWQAQTLWRSEQSGGQYPVQWSLFFGSRILRIVALFHDQEVDARASTGGYYWEGAVSLLEGDRLLGRGYLELTGYASPISI